MNTQEQHAILYVVSALYAGGAVATAIDFVKTLVSDYRSGKLRLRNAPPADVLFALTYLIAFVAATWPLYLLQSMVDATEKAK